MFFLDTNTCIYFLNGKYPHIKENLLSHSPIEIKIPSIVKAELLFGANKSKIKNTILTKVENFLEPFEIVAFNDSMSYVYADLRFDTEKKGQQIVPNDLLIASIVKFHKGVLVTNNLKEFNRVEDLLTVNWAIE
jgi:tRNA(fMet)-specific endonuclease VapC